MMRGLTLALLLTLGCSSGSNGNNLGTGGGAGLAGGSGGRGGSGTGGSAGAGGSSGTGGTAGLGGSAGRDGSPGRDGGPPRDGPVQRLDGSRPPDGARADAPPASSGKAFVIAGGTYGGSAITVLELNKATGALTRRSTATAGSGPTYVALHPNARFVYANNEMGGRVQGWSINPQTGALTALNGQPSGGDGPTHISVHKSGRWLLVANISSGNAAVLAIDGQGRLGAPMTTGRVGGDAHMILDDGQSGNFVLMPCAASGFIALFRFDTNTGMLTPNTPATVSTGPRPRHMAVHPSGRFAYLTHETGDPMTTFAYNSTTGVLSAPTSITGLADGNHVVVHPNGNFVYQLARTSSGLQISRIAEDGALTAVNRVTDLATPWDIIGTRDFSYLFVASSVGNTVRSFSVDPTTGLLTSRGSGPTQESPHSVVVAEF